MCVQVLQHNATVELWKFEHNLQSATPRPEPDTAAARWAGIGGAGSRDLSAHLWLAAAARPPPSPPRSSPGAWWRPSGWAASSPRRPSCGCWTSGTDPPHFIGRSRNLALNLINTQPSLICNNIKTGISKQKYRHRIFYILQCSIYFFSLIYSQIQCALSYILIQRLANLHQLQSLQENQRGGGAVRERDRVWRRRGQRRTLRPGELWLAETGHVTTVLVTDWSVMLRLKIETLLRWRWSEAGGGDGGGDGVSMASWL